MSGLCLRSVINPHPSFHEGKAARAQQRGARVVPPLPAHPTMAQMLLPARRDRQDPEPWLAHAAKCSHAPKCVCHSLLWANKTPAAFFFFFSVCLLCLTFKKILSHILICLTLLSSHMLPAGSSCLPFLQIHLEVLYLVFSLGIVFLHQKGVESPAEPGFQNSCFGIIGENLLVLILSC